MNDSNDFQYVFWSAGCPAVTGSCTTANIYETFYAGGWNNGSLADGPLWSALGVGVDSHGVQYVFWKGTTSSIYGSTRLSVVCGRGFVREREYAI